MKRILVTGMGAITPIGLSAPEFWRNLTAGVSGVGPITQFDASDLQTRIAAEVKGFNPRDFMDHRAARRMEPFAQFAVAAARQALADADFSVTESNATRIGVVMNTGGGGYTAVVREEHELIEKGPSKVSPFFVPMMAPNMAATQISIQFGIRGPVVASVAACAAGVFAFIEAYHILQRGEADIMIAGGTEAGIVPLAIAGLANMQALSRRNDEPTRASRPFDRDRDGFVFGEAAGALVLETEEHARARGALGKAVAQVIGGAVTGDAYHVTAPQPEGLGAIEAMRRALQYSGLRPEDVDYIAAHGTGTTLNDAAETNAIKQVFGEHAYRLAISSPKSMVGHTLGAAGAVSALATVCAIRDGLIAPTINLDNPDPVCDLDYVPNQARRATVRAAIVNGFGFGGQNGVAAFRALE